MQSVADSAVEGRSRNFSLGIDGFDYRDLFRSERLEELLGAFDATLRSADADLYRAYADYRQNQGADLGDIAISDPRLPGGTVPFRLVYDDAWLDLTFKSDLAHRRALRKRWVDDATKTAVNEYYNAAVKAYRYSKGRGK